VVFISSKPQKVSIPIRDLMNLELVETAQAIAQAVVSIPIRDLMNLELG